jgi:phage terminase large subunit
MPADNDGPPEVQPEESDIRENKFTPLPKQEEFIKATESMVMLSGGFGTGKSRAGCEKGYFLNMQYPGNRGLIVRKHFSDVKASTIKQTLTTEVIPESHIVEHNKTDHIIKHHTGVHDPTGDPILSEIHYHGLDSGRNTSSDDLPRKIGSMAYGWIFVDEGSELSLGEWTQLQGRLRYRGSDQGGIHYPVPFRQIFTATNPDAPTHWMYDLFYNQQQGKKIEMSVDDNKYLPEDYVENMRSQFSGTYYERYFEGKWVGAEGMIYEDWRHDDHLLDWHELPGNWELIREQDWQKEGKGVWAKPPDNWQIYRAIDFGYNNPFVCQWWARSPDDELVLFRELYKTETLVEDIAKEIKSNDPEGFVIERTFADHDAEDAATLQRHGVDVAKAKKDVQQGIQAVMGRLRFDERGKARLYVMNNARVHPPDKNLDDDNSPLCTAEEIPLYTWKDNADEKPEKKDDHGCDALRYMAYSLDSGNTPSKQEMDDWADIINSSW